MTLDAELDINASLAGNQQRYYGNETLSGDISDFCFNLDKHFFVTFLPLIIFIHSFITKY